eukprot:NODE_260_length_12610_cov_0.413076.p4 type:complete len:255 gc:universal NODE_260_length_12610_cov_0.413076:11298-10534(-)
MYHLRRHRYYLLELCSRIKLLRMSDVEDTKNDFELMEQQSKFLSSILPTDQLDKLGALESIINNIFTIKGELNDSVYEDAIVVMEDRSVVGHVIDVYGSFDDAVNYCCVKSLNCSEMAWKTLIESVQTKKYIILYAVQSLSSKMNKLEIKEQQKEEEDFNVIQTDSDSESVITDSAAEEGEITKESFLSKYEDLFKILEKPRGIVSKRLDSVTEDSLEPIEVEKKLEVPESDSVESKEQVLMHLPGLLPVYTNK